MSTDAAARYTTSAQFAQALGSQVLSTPTDTADYSAADCVGGEVRRRASRSPT